MKPNELKQRKKELRRSFRVRRDAMSQRYRQEASEAICANLIEWIKPKAEIPFHQVFGFVAVGAEPNIEAFVVSASIRQVVGLPRITNDNGEVGGVGMEFRRWNPGDPMAVNQFKINEPLSSASILTGNDQTVILVPALAIDGDGYRLGYGGGYYDRYISQLKQKGHKPITVGVVFAPLLQDSLPREPHDVPVDFIVSEDGVTTPVNFQFVR